MKNNLFIAGVIMLALALTGCSHPVKQASVNNSAELAALKNPQTITHRTLSLQIPGDWKEVKQDMLLYYLPVGSVATDTVSEKVVAAVYSVPAKSTSSLAQLMNDDFNVNQRAKGGWTFVTSTEPVKLGPLTAREEVYEYQIIGKKILIDQVDAKNGEYLYKFQHLCVSNVCQYSAIYKAILASFKPITP